jgi:ribosomal protein S27AE
MSKQVGGAGRGNSGVIKNDTIPRPDCPKCGGFLKSSAENRWRCTSCGHNPRKIKKDEGIKDYNDSLGFNPVEAEALARRCEQGTRLIVTSAQNNSEAFLKGLQALKQAAKYYQCELAIIPSHYLNVTLWKKESKKEFDPLVIPHLVKSEIRFGNVRIKSDVRIQPTSLSPLNAKHSHGGRDWLVFGHPQLCREPVATAGNQFPKLMFTTGSITHPNYSVSDAGEKGKWHHCFAALILEKHKDFVFVRQLGIDDNGHIYDLDVRFTPKGFTLNNRIEALTTGDEHVKFNIVEKATYGKGGIVSLLQPKYIVRHDVLDGYAGSHHHEKDPMIQFIKHHNGDDDYRKELDQCVAFINRTTPKYATTLIVPSNHHDHLAKWLARSDANKDHRNALLILEMQAKMREAALKCEPYDPFYLYCKDKLTCSFEFLDRNQPFYIHDVDHSQHLDVGTNGARGSAKGLAKTPDKITGGHSHGARIYQGVYQAGTSTGRLDYERGLSDHSTSHVIQYQNGKRAIIDIHEGEFCGARK